MALGPGGGASGDRDSLAVVLLALVVSVGGLFALAMAARRRRRPSDPGTLAVVAAGADGAMPGGLDAPPPGLLERAAIAPVVDPAEAHMPRWRRPSVKAARYGGAPGPPPGIGGWRSCSSARRPQTWNASPCATTR